MRTCYDNFVWPTCFVFGMTFWIVTMYLIYYHFGIGVWQVIVAILAGYSAAFLACLTTAIIFVTIDWVVAGWRKVKQAQ